MLYSKSACPVDDFDKTWIDNSLIWFEHKLGKAFIKERDYLIPAHCKFVYPYFDSQEAIQYFIEFICNYIKLDANLIEYRLVWDDPELDFIDGIDENAEAADFVKEYHENESGQYVIFVDESQLHDFDTTFLELVYKLVYVKLKSQKIFTFENGYMINYAMVLYGFGILMANTFVRTRQWKGLRYSAWEVRRLGFLNHRMYGYMFAVLSKYRDEKDELWQKYFCTDVDKFHKQATTFLEEQMEEENEAAAAGIYIKDEDVFFEKYFYEAGGIQLIAHLKDNQYEGLSVFYHPNGILWSERIYKNGMPFTVLSNYNRFDEAVEKGTLLGGDGTLYLYRPDGNLNEIETYKDGLKINIEKHNSNS